MKYLFVILIFFSLPAFGASFDCNKAATDQEKMICSDADLNKLDSKMGYLYQEALAFDRDFIKRNQRNFIKEYKKCNSKKNCSDLLDNQNAAFDSYIREYSANPDSCKFAKKIIVAVQNNDINSLLDLMPNEMGSGPQKKYMRDKNLRDVFTDKWIQDISDSLCGFKMGSKGYMIDSGKIWYDDYPDNKWKIITINDDFKKQKAKKETPIGWNYKGKLLRPGCFDLADYRPDTVVTPMKDCLSQNSQKIEINNDEIYQYLFIDGSNVTKSYKVAKRIDNNLCQKIAINPEGKCLESNLLERTTYAGGSMGPESKAAIYGIFKLDNGEEYIVPLKVFDTINDGLSYLDSLPAN